MDTVLLVIFSHHYWMKIIFHKPKVYQSDTPSNTPIDSPSNTPSDSPSNTPSDSPSNTPVYTAVSTRHPLGRRFMDTKSSRRCKQLSGTMFTHPASILRILAVIFGNLNQQLTMALPNNSSVNQVLPTVSYTKQTAKAIMSS